VNVILVPVLGMIRGFANSAGLQEVAPDTYQLIGVIWKINLGLLIFNMLPVYPLDGGQILRALLWFPLGEIRSLQIASAIGLVGGLGLAALALLQWSFWIGLLAFFLISRAVAGWQYARAMVAEQNATRPPSVQTPG
jgi:Zn-dependent protease